MSNEMKDWMRDRDEEEQLNNEFCKLHPWALARDWRGEPIYGSNMMDNFMPGWSKAFEDSFVKEMDIAYNALPDDEKKDFYFLQEMNSNTFLAGQREHLSNRHNSFLSDGKCL